MHKFFRQIDNSSFRYMQYAAYVGKLNAIQVNIKLMKIYHTFYQLLHYHIYIYTI